MLIQKNETWILAGASSGLGKEFSAAAQEKFPEVRQVLVSRRSACACDFSKQESWVDILKTITEQEPTRILYFAGGGPWGPYPDKKWSSHEWTYRVNFLFPAFLLSQVLPKTLQQILFVGSSIAESQPDPGAASYSASKHALKGLVTTLQAERSLKFDLRLLSPGYLDTALLPANAWPRQVEGLVSQPKAVAERTLSWVQDVHSANGHLILG